MLDLKVRDEPALVEIPHDGRERHVAGAHEALAEVVDAVVWRRRFGSLAFFFPFFLGFLKFTWTGSEVEQLGRFLDVRTQMRL